MVLEKSGRSVLSRRGRPRVARECAGLRRTGARLSGIGPVARRYSTQGWYLLVAAGYFASFVFLSLGLRTGLPLGVAYGIWGALGVASTAILAAVIFGEPLTVVMLLGVVLIIGGVLAVELGSERATNLTEEVA